MNILILTVIKIYIHCNGELEPKVHFNPMRVKEFYSQTYSYIHELRVSKCTISPPPSDIENFVALMAT